METFGRLSIEGNFWVVKCEPHVRARLKRTFPRAPKQPGELIKISCTPENSRDLEWFLLRYPMDMDCAETLKADALLHRDQELRIADLLARREPPPTVNLAKPARDYQAVVPQFVDIRGGLLLGDHLGLGKTVSAICCLTNPNKLPAVIVAPPHLLRHWAAKLAEFTPELTVHVVKKGTQYPFFKEKRGAQPSLLPPRLPDVIVVSYFMLRGWADYLSEIAQMVIFEECQQLRRPGTGIDIACQLMASKVSTRLGLSATPIFNFGNEFFFVVNTLLPGALGTYEEFVREWCTVDGSSEHTRISDPVRFGAYLRREGIMLLRTRKDVGRELPPLNKIVHEVEADPKVLEKLTGNAIELAKTILARGESFRGEKMQAAGEFDMIMRQATGIAKAPYVAEMVRLLTESGEKVVLFGWHRAVYDIWMEKLRDLAPVLYSGSESPTQKAASLKAFIEGDSQVLIMSLRSGIGVDGLQQVCRTVVFGELDWSPGVHEQCMGRVDRDGKEDETNAYFMIADDGSDPIMADVLGIKRDQIEGVRNPDLALVERADNGENNLRALARQLLANRGIEIPTAAEPLELVEA